MNYNKYHNNKMNYQRLFLTLMGGSKGIDWNDIVIIKELGKGYNGTTFSVKINDKIYALKRQKITLLEYNDTNKSTLLPINRELFFFEWINGLSENDKKFFMRMYYYRRYECDFQFVPLRGTLSDELQESKYCQDIILDKKDATIENIIDHLDKNKIISVFCQTVYAIYLMHRSDYYHFDTKLDNICFNKTKHKKIKLGIFGKIKTHGLNISLIDYGNILNINYEMNENEKELYDTAKLCNLDLFLLVEYVLMNNVKIYRQIDKHRINIKPREVFEIIKTIDPNVYKTLISYIYDEIKLLYVKDFDFFLQNGGTFDECKKIPKHMDILFEIMHVYQLLFKDKYYKSLNSYFNMVFDPNELLFTTDEILYVKKNHMNLNLILNKFINYIK